MTARAQINLLPHLLGPVPRWSPEYIEFWHQVFERHQLHQRGVLFEVFLTAPRRELRRVIARDYYRIIKLDHGLERYPRFAEGCLIFNREQIEQNIDAMVVNAVRIVEQRWEDRWSKADPSLMQRNGTWIQRLSRRFWPRRIHHP